MAAEATPFPLSRHPQSVQLTRVAAFPNLRVLAWAGNVLYASRGYTLLRANVSDPAPVQWTPVAHYLPTWWRGLSSSARLASRLFRDGFHALAVLSSGDLVAAVPGAIIRHVPGSGEFQTTHRVLRGTRPLHIAATSDGRLYWGEYFDNPDREEVHIYGSVDRGATWYVAFTFPNGSIRHVHNIIFDQWQQCLWLLTGDDGAESRILRASLDFKTLDVVLSGSQQTRAVAAIPTTDGLYFSTDTPSEQNYVYRLDREGNLTKITSLSSSSIYGCRVGDAIFFSTMVEPSTVNLDRHVRLYGVSKEASWQSLLEWKKDLWPKGLFQYGNVFLPDGENGSGCLALTAIAVQGADMGTTLWRV